MNDGLWGGPTPYYSNIYSVDYPRLNKNAPLGNYCASSEQKAPEIFESLCTMVFSIAVMAVPRPGYCKIYLRLSNRRASSDAIAALQK
jgi:hypothetical protein